MQAERVDPITVRVQHCAVQALRAPGMVTNTKATPDGPYVTLSMVSLFWMVSVHQPLHIAMVYELMDATTYLTIGPLGPH